MDSKARYISKLATQVTSAGKVPSSNYVLDDSGVTPGNYGSASQIPVFAIDSKGRVTSATNVAVAGVSSFTYNTSTGRFTIGTADGASYTADVTLAPFTTTSLAEGTNQYFTTARARESISGTGSLSYSSSTGVMSFTQGNTDTISEGATNLYYTAARSRGAISYTPGSASYNSTSGVITIPSTTSHITESGNLYYTDIRVRAAVSAGTGVTYNSSTGTFSIGQSVGTGDNVTFNNLTVAGNLTVSGTTTVVNSTTVSIADVNLELARNATTAAQANGAGITVAGPVVPATLTYSNTDDRWNFNKNLNVSTVFGALSGNATTASTLENTRSISITGDATWTVNFNGGSNVSAALTLANSGVTAGTYNNVTVNAKGLVTSGSNTAYLTSYTETDTLASVTGRGASTSTAITINNTLTASGNVAVGTTPSTFIANWFAIEVGKNASIQTTTADNLFLGFNTVYGASGYVNKTANQASGGYFFDTSGNAAIRYAAAQATAGTVISYVTPFTFTGSTGAFNATGAITQAGNQVLHAGNYNSYSPTLTGGNASGTWGINITGSAGSAGTLISGATINGTAYFRKNQTQGDYTTAPLWAESYGNTSTGIAFHISGVAGRYLEMRNNSADLFWQSSAILNAGNYSSYALPLSGGTLSGVLTASSGIYATKIGISSSNLNDTVNGAPWYGIGNTDLNFQAAQVPQFAGYYGLRIRSASTVMDFAPSGDPGNINVSSGGFKISGNAALHAGNYGTYLNNSFLRAIGEPTTATDWNSFGNTYPNTIQQITFNNFTSTATGPTAASYSYGTLLNFSAQSSSQAQIFISHAGNDLIFRGGWGGASWQTWNKVLTNQNYNSYSPSLTGTGASGTWGINVTGSAGSISGISTASILRGNQGVGATGARTTNFGGDSAQGLSAGFYDISSGTNMPTTSWYHLIANAHSNSYAGNQYEFHIATEFWDKSSFYMRSISPGSIGPWRTLLHNGNYSSYALPLSGGTVSGNTTIGRDLYISDQIGGNYGNRLVVGASSTSYTLQDTNLRPTIQIHGAYPVLSLNHTVTSNTNHGGVVQFTSNGTGNQFVIGMTGNGSALSMGYSAATDWNPHNGISGYNGTSYFHATSSGYIGLGSIGDWGGTGGGDPAYHLHFKGANNAASGFAAVFENTVNATNNGGGVLIQNTYGSHSWGIVSEFRVAAATGDRPSILFSNGGDTNTWAIGYGAADSAYFRINRDHGHRNGSWGTTLMTMDRSGNVTFAGNVTAYSDERLKYDVNTISNALSIISKLRGVTFLYKEDDRAGLGLIAQEVEKVLPVLVSQSPNSHGEVYKNVAYSNIVAVLIEAIKEQQDIIESQEARIARLEALVETLINKVGE